MADLLTAADRSEIRLAMQDVFDTYMKEPAILKVRNQGERLAAFNEGRDSHKSAVEFEVNVLYLPDKTDADSEANKSKGGYFDNSEGVIYIPVSILKATTPALWDDATGADIKPNRDNIIIKGENLTIMGVNPVGPDESSFFMVKIQYFKEMASRGVGE